MSSPSYKITVLSNVPLSSPVLVDNKILTSTNAEIALPSTAGTLAEISDIPTDYVNLAGAQTISGVKTFSAAPVISSISNSSATLTMPSSSGTLALSAEVVAQKERIDRLVQYLKYWINAGGVSMSDIDSVVDPSS